MTAALELRGLSVHWPDTDAACLDGVGGVAPQGQWTAIIGPNGAGKSTLLRAAARLLPEHTQTSGEVIWQGRELHQWSRAALAQHLAWLGQAEQGGDEWQAMDVVRLGRLPQQGWWPKSADAEDEAIVEQAMRQTDTWSLRHTPLRAMSGGERQRVRLARVLAVQAQVLLMDEPLANLDPPHQADWLGWVRQLNRNGQTVISVLHELNMALRADHIWLVHHGDIVAQGSADQSEMRAAIERAFGHRVSLHRLHDQWVALPEVQR
ncbi:MAG: hypothetical protein RL357_1722 [Pseudomonadota bacterium]|jgi:iron complex transport system ATP-binding protein